MFTYFRAAPRLKDAEIHSQEEYRSLYKQLLIQIWKLYHLCRLIHADLSEYNLLVHKSILYMIDVSQSVEHDHPNALEFLRKDLSNVQAFFRKYGVRVPNMRTLFEYVVKSVSEIPNSTGSDLKSCIVSHTSTPELDTILDSYTEDFMKMVDDMPDGHYMTQEMAVDESVFKSTFIPRTLDEVAHFEREVFEDRGTDQVYKSVVGMQDTSSSDDDTDEESEDDDFEVSSLELENEFEERQSKVLKKDEDKEVKRERKRAVKEEKRVQRENKMPKKVKRRKEKESSGKKKK